MRIQTWMGMLAVVAVAMVGMLATPVRAANPAILGRHWIDANCNGLYDQGEAPITGISLYLYRFGADGVPFTSDDRQMRTLGVFFGGAKAGWYEDDADSSRMLTDERYRLSILQGGRPAGYIPTKYRAGDDPSRWSSLQSNWTTGDLPNKGFAIDPNASVTGGNIGIAPVSCTAQWYTEHVYLPLTTK